MSKNGHVAASSSNSMKTMKTARTTPFDKFSAGGKWLFIATVGFLAVFLLAMLVSLFVFSR